MIRGGSLTCASCARFPRAGLEGAGVAPCAIRGEPQGFADPACVLHEPAADRAQRRALVVAMEQAREGIK